jgi:hypothetical protein
MQVTAIAYGKLANFAVDCDLAAPANATVRLVIRQKANELQSTAKVTEASCPVCSQLQQGRNRRFAVNCTKAGMPVGANCSRLHSSGSSDLALIMEDYRPGGRQCPPEKLSPGYEGAPR